jgi:hypothetical protein
MRVNNPYQEMGVAQRVSVNSRFADFSTLDVDFESKSENFNPVIQRGRANTYTRTQSLNIINKYFINKFFPNSWGLDIPITLRRNYTTGRPRYRANSDLLIENIQDPTVKERENTESLTYYGEFGYSMRNEPASKILEYTLGKITLSGNLEQRYNQTSTAVDTTLSWRGTMGYNLSFPSDKTSFVLFKNYRIGFFPTAFNNSFTINNNEPNSWNWELREGSYDWYPRAYTTASRLFTSDNSITWPFTSDVNFTARINTKRDLLQKQYLQDLNIGKQTEYVQDLGLNYNPTFFPRFWNLSTNVTARYTDMMRKYFENQDGQQVEVYQSDGNSNRGFRANISLMNSTLLGGLVQKLKQKSPQSSSPKDPKAGAMDEMSEEERKKFEELMENPELKYLEDEQRRKDEEEKKRLEDEKKKQEASEAEEQKETDKSPETDPSAEPDKTEMPDDEQKKDPEQKDGDESGETEDPEEKADPEAKEEEPEQEKAHFNPLITALDYLARVKNISASYQNAYAMNYTRKTELPNFAFQLGIPHSMPRDYLDAIGNDNTLTLSSGIFFGRNLDSTINFAHSFNRRYSSASQQNKSTTFPDITLSLMNWEPWLGISKYLQGGRLNTGFQYTTRASGDIDWVKPKQESKTVSLSPLIGFTGNIMNKLNTNLSVSVSQTENITDMDSYDIIKNSDNITMNGNLTYSFTAGRGFTIPFTGKKIHINNQLSSSLGITFDKSKDVTKGRDNSQVDRDTSRLTITPSATYQFDRNIRGGLTSSYELNSDRKRDDGSRIFSLGVWVEVNL